MSCAQWSPTPKPPSSLPDALEDGSPTDVVVVEDEPDVRETLGLLLEAWGYRVCLAEDGEQGLDLIVGSQPRVAVVDIAMPRADGYTVARRVRAALGDRAPRLVALTAFGREQDRRRAFEAGFDAHLTKPARLELLRQIIANFVD